MEQREIFAFFCIFVQYFVLILAKESLLRFTEVLHLTTKLNLILKTVEDAENFYVDFFLKTSVIPLKLSVYDGPPLNHTSNTEVGLHALYPGEQTAFAIVVQMDTIQEDMTIFIRSSGKFFFIIIDEVDIHLIEYALRSIWMPKGSVYIYFLTSDDIYTFHPFIFNFETRVYGMLTKFNDSDHAKEIFKNMNGYPLIIERFRSAYSVPIYRGKEIIDYRGMDTKVALLLQERMNFTFIRRPADSDMFGNKLPNGTFNGALGRILRGETDAAITGFFIKDYGTHDMEYTVSVYSDKLCCYVPKAKRVPQSVLPLFSLDSTMWMCYVFTAFTCGAVLCVIRLFNLWLENQRKVAKDITWQKRQFLQIFIDIWLVWVRVGLRHLPIYLSERLFILYVALVSVIIGAIFDSSLATVYVKPLYYKDINTLAELDNTNFRILFKYASMKDDLFPNDTSALFESLNRKLQFVDASTTKESMVEMMARKRNFASVTRDSVLILENIKYFTANILHKIPECPKTYTLAYVLPKHSIYSKRINTLLLRFLEAGLINKWIDEMYFAAELSEAHVEHARMSFKVLTIKDLQLPFYALLLGTIIASLALISEKFSIRKNKKVTVI